MKKRTKLGIIFALLAMTACDNSITGTDENQSNSYQFSGSWIHVADSTVSTSTTVTTTVLGSETSVEMDTTIEQYATFDEIYERSEDSIWVYSNANDATVKTGYANELVYGEGIMSQLNVNQVQEAVNYQVAALTPVLEAIAEDVVVSAGDIVVSDPVERVLNGQTLIEHRGTVTVTATGSIMGTNAQMVTEVETITFSIYEKYSGELPPSSWPQIVIDN